MGNGKTQLQREDRDLDRMMLFLEQRRKTKLRNTILSCIGGFPFVLILLWIILDDLMSTAWMLQESSFTNPWFLGTFLIGELIYMGLYMIWIQKRYMDNTPMNWSMEAAGVSEQWQDSENESFHGGVLEYSRERKRRIAGPGLYSILRDEAGRRMAGILLLRLYRMCGEPLEIDQIDIDGMSVSQKLLFLEKAGKERWVYLTRDNRRASLEKNFERDISEHLGYKP